MEDKETIIVRVITIDPLLRLGWLDDFIEGDDEENDADNR